MAGANVAVASGPHLAAIGAGTHDSRMSLSCRHDFPALLLVLLFALGISLAPIGANLMAADMDMALSAEAAGPCPHACAGCGDDGGIDAAACVSLCGAAAQALSPAPPAGPPSVSRGRLEIDHPVTGGCLHGPNPDPPRPLAFA